MVRGVIGAIVVAIIVAVAWLAGLKGGSTASAAIAGGKAGSRDPNRAKVVTTPPGPAGYYSRDSVRADPSRVYLFGENDEQKNTGALQQHTQAVIRGLPNAVGIRTCYAPGRGYDDATLADNTAKIRDDFAAARALFDSGWFSGVVLPGDGLGTGVAALNTRPEAAGTYAALRAELDAFVAHILAS